MQSTVVCGRQAAVLILLFFFFRQKTAYEIHLSLVGSEVCIGDSCLDGSGLRKVAEAAGDKSGIVMDVETTLEGVQLYTANFLSDRTGKGGAHYGPFGGFCLGTQHYPDAINQPAFPSPVLRRGEQLHETTIYRFGVRK